MIRDFRVNKQTLGDGSFTLTYEPSKTKIIDRSGHTKRFEFPTGASSPLRLTCADRFVQVVAGSDYVTEYDYNGETELIRLKSPEGAVTTFDYDDGNGDWLQRGNLIALTRLPIPGRQSTVMDTVITPNLKTRSPPQPLSDFATDPQTRSLASMLTSFKWEPRFQQLKSVTNALGLTTTLLL